MPLYDDKYASGFPNPLPVLIEVRKAEGVNPRPELARKAKDAIQWAGLKRWRLDANAAAPSDKGVWVQHVQVTLYPYEQYDLEATCLPDEARLAKWFSLVETIGVQMLQGQADPACSQQLVRACALSKAEMAAMKLAGLSAGATAGLCNLPACDEQGNMSIAGQLLSCIRNNWPLTEIAAPTVLRVAHAVNAPQDAPMLHDIEIARPAGKPADILPKEWRWILPRKPCSPQDVAPWRYERAEGATQALLTGEIEVDLEQIDAIEVIAWAVSPGGKAMDDSTRGRGLLARRSGRWPSVPGQEEKSDSAPGEKQKRDYYYKRAVLGFDVDSNGAVGLVAEKATLLRVTNLPDPRLAAIALTLKDPADPEGKQSPFLGACGRKIRLDLGVLHSAAAAANGKGLTDPNSKHVISVSRPQDVADRLGRRLWLEVVGVSRFARAFETAPMFSDGAEKLLARRRPLLPWDQRLTGSERTTAYSPATARPAAAGARAPQVYFRLLRDAFGMAPALRQTLTRKCGVRLRFDRGWFSAGEGERLGIVLWPPHYKEQTAKGIECDNLIWIRDGKKYAELYLPDLMDGELGDGGAFVSRWGGDPIRGELTPQKGWFMPPTAFSCMDRSEYDEYFSGAPDAPQRAHSPRYVEAIRMPVEASDPASPDDKTTPKPIASWLEVSLLTFEPYFDVEAEEWYVDVPMSLARATDPFIRFGLVRYQENAVADELKVSPPVRVWTQLPPQRELEVTSTRAGAGCEVVATARGQASAGRSRWVRTVRPTALRRRSRTASSNGR